MYGYSPIVVTTRFIREISFGLKLIRSSSGRVRELNITVGNVSRSCMGQTEGKCH